MEMSGELHAPTALPPRKQLVVVLLQAGWTTEPVWKIQRRAKFLSPTGTETLTPHVFSL
jgi:hypothetical protein